MNILTELDAKLREALDRFRESLRGIRGGRPTSKLVEDLSVECYGQRMALKQLGSITVIPPREIQISLWDPEVVVPVAKAIEDFLTISPSIEGMLIRVHLPPLSGERREELMKLVKREAEDTRIRVRGLRDESNKAILRDEDAGILPEDDRFRLKDQVQKRIDTINTTIQELVDAKLQEVNE